MKEPEIDWLLFGAAVGLIVAVCIPMILVPEQASMEVTALYNWIAGRLGLLYQWMTIASTVILAVIAFGKYGHRRLGGADARPAYSDLSWISMLFCAGVGAGLLYWAAIEWAHYLKAPPFGLAPGSASAREWAASYGIFHWGLSAWCLYCLPTVAIAYPYYERNIPYLRLSTSLAGLFGDDVVHRPLGRAVDFLFIIALVGGTGTSLALTTPMVAACASRLLGVPESFGIDLAAFAASVALIATSVYLGLDRGIKRLSDINVGLAGLFLLFMLLAGPTFFLLKLGTNSLGLILQNFIRMNTWTEPIRHSHFVENWTIFYWAWWIAYGPFMGLFVTRISRGRTLKQLILSMVGFGALGCAAFYIVMGNTAMWMDMRGVVPVQAMVAAGRANDAIAQVMAALPWQPMPLIAFIVMALVFAATTYDSASYAIASAATRYLSAGANPHRWHRVFWAFALAVLPITLIVVGGLHAILSAVLVASLPLLAIGVAMIIALFRDLRTDSCT